jgi:diaminopimelate decarboxylase
MHYFEYRESELHCEGVPLRKIADEVGTPVYIYSEETLRRHVRVFDEAFQSVPHLICYAVKANSNINVLRRFTQWGIGFDIVSGGELFRVLRAGAPAKKVIFAGVGKTAEEIPDAPVHLDRNAKAQIRRQLIRRKTTVPDCARVAEH